MGHEAVEPGSVTSLHSGAEARVTNGAAASRAVVLVDGGRGGDVPGTWSASLEWLVGRLAPRLPGLGLVEVKYRVKSWNRLAECTEDARAALDLATERGADSCALVGFSMGGAVAIRASSHPAVSAVIGLAPWIPERLELAPLVGKRFAVVHGALDRYLPGIPGVSPGNSMRGYRRARKLGVLDAEYTLIPGALHGIALRAPWGLTPLFRARRWAGLVEDELRRFQAEA